MTSEQTLLSSINLPACLKDRILCRAPPSPFSAAKQQQQQQHQQHHQQQHHQQHQPTYVLYLPTVVLRKRHNPAFAFACYLANYYNVPLIVLVTILDDKHLTRKPLSPICMTSRRLAFTLEALQESCCYEWETVHGAGVAIRVHSNGARTPHYLTLAHSAMAVVNDEPFVEPYRTYVRQIVKTCKSAGVSCWTVDGSTTVPPNLILQQQQQQQKVVIATTSSSSQTTATDGDLHFTGAPNKAWRWEKQTNAFRKKHVFSAYKDKSLDAPELICKLPCNFFRQQLDNMNDDKDNSNNNDDDSDDICGLKRILDLIPSKWKEDNASSPGQRPWTVKELTEIDDCKKWAISWEGADNTVLPCQQTNGSQNSAIRRWKHFISDESGGLKMYAKRRNQIINPHGVSRISCYLNLGILSIFDIIYDVWHIQSSRSGYTTGCNKYLEEVIKWREGSYVHAFASPDYHSQQILPSWSCRYLESLFHTTTKTGNTTTSSRGGYDYKQLETASTRDEIWNAMQSYLIDTGELHNNARMTWGKTVVHWQSCRSLPNDVLWQLCCLNDRFALDGLSPPSYGGILWCFGWGDKPTVGKKEVSTKWAHRYRTGPNGFELAKGNIYKGNQAVKHRTKRIEEFCDRPSAAKKIRLDNEKTLSSKNNDEKSAEVSTKPKSKTILSFFSPKKLNK